MYLVSRLRWFLSEICRIAFCACRQFRFRFSRSSLSESEKSFVSVNTAYWSKQGSRQEVDLDADYVFVVPEGYPLILVGNAHIAAIIADKKNYNILLLVDSSYNDAARQVLRSFPRVRLVEKDSLPFLWLRFVSCFRSIATSWRWRTPDDVLQFTLEGTHVGDLIYDLFLAKQFATLKDVRRVEVLSCLQKFYYQWGVISRLTRKYKVRMGLLSHIVGFSGGALRCMLNQGIEVIVRASTLKKYTSISMVHECVMMPDERYIALMKRQQDVFLPLADQCLEDRFANRNEGKGDLLPYLTEKQVYTSRESFCSKTGLDPSKKNVFVMLHAFNDYPHTYAALIHQDYYEWMMAVLDEAQEVDSVNWIFKEHPYASYYPTRDLELGSVFEEVDVPHIHFLDENANFNTSSLKYLADVIVTTLGTSGLEYACVGVPCVLAGEALYSGFGFSIDPKTDGEFREVLQNIDKLQRLTDEQVAMAKLLALFTFDIVDVKKLPDPFRTICTFNIDEQRDFTDDQVFEVIVKYRNQSTHDEKAAYIESINEFLKNPNYKQLVNFSKYPMLREALDSLMMTDLWKE